MIYLLARPVAPEERDAYCADAAAVAIDLGARDAEVPRTWNALSTYLERMYGSGAIAVSPPARELASAETSLAASVVFFVWAAATAGIAGRLWIDLVQEYIS